MREFVIGLKAVSLVVKRSRDPFSLNLLLRLKVGPHRKGERACTIGDPASCIMHHWSRGVPL